jgi:RecG-like helicase
MKSIFNQATAPIIRRNDHWSFDNEAEKKEIRRNLRVQRRVKQALAEALALSLFQAEFGHKPSAEEKREIIPQHHATTRRIRVTTTVIEVDINSLFATGESL